MTATVSSATAIEWIGVSVPTLMAWLTVDLSSFPNQLTSSPHGSCRVGHSRFDPPAEDCFVCAGVD